MADAGRRLVSEVSPGFTTGAHLSGSALCQSEEDDDCIGRPSLSFWLAYKTPSHAKRHPRCRVLFRSCSHRERLRPMPWTQMPLQRESARRLITMGCKIWKVAFVENREGGGRVILTSIDLAYGVVGWTSSSG